MSKETTSTAKRTVLSTTSNIYLVGDEYHQILGPKLPSIKQVLCVLFYNTRTVKLSIRENARLVVDELSIFWHKARIPIRRVQHCITKVEKLHHCWKSLQKDAHKRTDFQKQKEKAFCDRLDDLFDVAHENAMEMMKREEDKEFLLQQRQKGRPGCMNGVDEAWFEKEKIRFEHEKREQLGKRKKEEQLQKKRKSAVLTEIDTSEREIDMDVDANDINYLNVESSCSGDDSNNTYEMERQTDSPAESIGNISKSISEISKRQKTDTVGLKYAHIWQNLEHLFQKMSEADVKELDMKFLSMTYEKIYKK